MGDPRKTRKKYEGPSHPWVASRLEEEKVLRNQFGTKNKRELYRMNSALKRFKDRAKTLASRDDTQAVTEREQMTQKIVGLGLVNPGATLDDILSLSVTDLMNRRLQTVLVKRLLARTTKQARQLIVHGHVLVGKKVITSPGYLVRIDEEAKITFRASSPFINDQHPERFSEEELKKQRERAAAKKSEKDSTEDEDAPPAYKEEDLEDPEEATSLKKPKDEAKTESKAAKPEDKAADDDSDKKPADAKPDAKPDVKPDAKSEDKAENDESDKKPAESKPASEVKNE